MNNITEKEFIGVIREGMDRTHQGKYLVYIRELMVTDSSLKPIWVKNETQGNRFSRWLDINTKQVQSSGSYFPLQQGMMVNVRFRSESLASGYITNTISYVPLIDKASLRDSMYVINKTKNDSWIYQDDNRDFTHIMQSGGLSNIVLDRDAVTILTGSPVSSGVDGVITQNALSVGSFGTKMSFGDASITMDETGITFTVGKTILSMTETGIKLLSKNIDISANEKLNLKGNDTKLMGSQDLNITSNILRLSGNTQCAITGNTVSLLGSNLTSIVSDKGQLELHGMTKTTLTAPIMELSALTNMSLSSTMTTVDASFLTLSGETAVLGSSALMIDGTILHGMGIASGIASGMKGMNTGLNKGMDLANAGITIATGNTDLISGLVNTQLTKALSGSAIPIGDILRPVIVDAKVGSGISEKVSYLTSSNVSYSMVVQDQFEGLRETHDIHV